MGEPKGGPGAWKGPVPPRPTQDGTKQEGYVGPSYPSPQPAMNAAQQVTPVDARKAQEDRVVAGPQPKGGPGAWKGPVPLRPTQDETKQEGYVEPSQPSPQPAAADAKQQVPSADAQTSRAEKWTPRSKVATGAGVGGPFSTVLAWSASQVGIVVPPEVAVALAALIIFLVGYLTPEASAQPSQQDYQ